MNNLESFLAQGTAVWAKVVKVAEFVTKAIESGVAINRHETVRTMLTVSPTVLVGRIHSRYPLQKKGEDRLDQEEGSGHRKPNHLQSA